MGAGNVLGVLARVFVDDIDKALPFYESLTGAEPEWFSFREVQLARVGHFLLLAGDTTAYRDRVATVLVRSLDQVSAELAAYDGRIIEGPTPGPNGRRLIAQHPDGAVFEYIEANGKNG